MKEDKNKEIFDLNLEMCLLTKSPINLGIGNIHSLSVKEISIVSFSLYNIYVNLLTTTSFYVAIGQCLEDEEYTKYFLNALSLFLKKPIIFDKVFFIEENDSKQIITEEIFECIQYILKKMHYQQEKEEEKPKFANKKAEQMWLKKQENDKKFEHLIKNKQTLPSIISGVAWKTNLGINAVSEMSIYQLYDAYNRLGLVDNYNYTMEGIYHGTIDNKEIKHKDLDWSQVIKVNK